MIETVVDLHKSGNAGTLVTAARLTVRVQRVDATELGSHAVAEARQDVDTNINGSHLEVPDLIDTGGDAVNNPLALSLEKVATNLKVVMALIDETAKVGISHKQHP